MIRKIEDATEILDFAWELSCDSNTASYPRQQSKDELLVVLDAKQTIVLASFNEDHAINGVCAYFYEEEVKYAQTEVFVIKDDYHHVAAQFIEEIKNSCVGYELYIGFPFENMAATTFFNANSYECIDASFDTRHYQLDTIDSNSIENITKINQSNFSNYATFHDKYATPLGMYYNSTNLKKDLDRFEIYVYEDHEQIIGSIFAKVVPKNSIAEVFGLFLDEEYQLKEVEKLLLIKLLNGLFADYGKLKEVLFFIDKESDDELQAALECGFEIAGTYQCFKIQLS